ncbi:hypothetical protein AwWohl_04360 [Gammaproteobacteria bacterium]|nr:hypothetical protein AwWohl_04360 [Gammaproteobacteria bacterium]
MRTIINQVLPIHSISKKITLGLLSIALLLGTSIHAQQKYINILTGGTSGVYYPLGVALSQIYTKIPDTKISVQATKASVENLNLLQQGKGELAFVLGDAVADAWAGNVEAGFKTKLDRLRAIAAIYPNYIQIIANKESGIKTLADLKGKRVSVGAAKSGTELNARAIFKAAGLSYQDFAKVEFLPYAESVELIKNRQLDATLQSSGLGMAAFRDLATTMPVVFIPIPEDLIKSIGSEAYASGIIPANTYEGQTQDIPTVIITNILVSHDKVSDEIAYQMTKGIFENLQNIQNAHSAAKDIHLEQAIKNLPIPLHTGAKRYYQEVGLIKSEL